MTDVVVKFFHGLGDISNFARMIPLYRKRGINVSVETSDDKKLVLQTAGAEVALAKEIHSWWQQSYPVITNVSSRSGWSGNKCGENLRHYGLCSGNGHPPSMEDLWEDYKKVDLQCKQLIPHESWIYIDTKIKNWSRPLILWHSMGNTNQSVKSFSRNQQEQFLRELIDQTDGTILLLDWDSRVNWTANHRIKHLIPEFGHIGLNRLAALMYRANLMIGVDSGPFYFSAYTNIPSVGIFFDGLHPCEYMAPWPRALTFSTGDKSGSYDPSKRFEYQTIASGGNMQYVAKWCSKMLQPSRYLRDGLPIAADVQLQQIVQEKCRGNGAAGGISTIYDRNRSFDIMLQECKKRFLHPKFVETGCIRSDEDWAGAGFSTALFGRYCQLTGGKLTSFDLSESNTNYARDWCKQFGDSVNIQCCRGDDGLRVYDNPIDVLYLDSLDTGEARHQECNLEEFKAAEHSLYDKSIVVIDDTPSLNLGKGGLTVPYMLENGWKILYAGYQVVLVKNV